MPKCPNKGIYTSMALSIVLLLALLPGGLTSGQYSQVPMEWPGPPGLEQEVPKRKEESRVKVLYPNGGEQWEIGKTYTIKWDAWNYPPVAKVRILLTGDPVGGRCDFPPSRNLPNTGSYEWNIPDHPRCPIALLGYKHKVRIFIRDKNSKDLGRGESEDYFRIIGPRQSIDLAYPDKGIQESFEVGKTYTIKWDAPDYPADAKIRIVLIDTRQNLRRPEGYMTIAETTNTGSYEWTPPGFSDEGYPLLGSQYKILVSIEDGGIGKFDVSEDLLSIVQAPLITLVSPNGGERWEIGKTYTIKWSAPEYSSDARVKIEVVGAVGYQVAKTTNTGSYDWTIPPFLGGRGWIFGYGDGKVDRFCVSIARGWHGEHDCNDEPFYIVRAFDIPFPKDGDTLEAAETYTIKWDASDYPSDASVRVSLRPLYHPGVGREFVIAETTNTGSYNWTPQTKSVYGNMIGGMSYLLVISVYEGDYQYAGSNSVFYIVEPFDILLPEAGRFEVGNTYTIKWDASRYPSDAEVKIKLRALDTPPGSEQEVLIADTTNTGKYAWTIQSESTYGSVLPGPGKMYLFFMIIAVSEDGYQHGESSTECSIAGPDN